VCAGAFNDHASRQIPRASSKGGAGSLRRGQLPGTGRGAPTLPTSCSPGRVPGPPRPAPPRPAPDPGSPASLLPGDCSSPLLSLRPAPSALELRRASSNPCPCLCFNVEVVAQRRGRFARFRYEHLHHNQGLCRRWF
jgi:hypothetical protein